MVQYPSVVIGVGEAGCKMASTLYDDLDRYTDGSFAEDFKFIGVDTQDNDLEDTTRDGFHTIRLESHDELFEKVKGKYGYLKDNMSLDPRGGATRQRGSSRFYIDNSENFDDLYRELEEQISTFAGSADETPFVWILNSLGGGTGSGAYPLLAGIISSIQSKIDEVFWMGGLGSFPELRNLADEEYNPDGDPELYTNSYSALRELAVLQDYDFFGPGSTQDLGMSVDYQEAAGAPFPIRIPLEAGDIKEIPSNEIKFEEPPFDFYFLMGLDEGTSKVEKEEMNRIAANTVLSFAYQTGVEDLSNDLGNICTIDSSALDVPVRTLDEYLKTVERLEDKKDDREEVVRTINNLAANFDTLAEVLDREPGDSLNSTHPERKSRFDPQTGHDLENPLEYEGSDLGINHSEAWEQIEKLLDSATEEAEEFYHDEYTEQQLDEHEQALLDKRESLTQDYDLNGDHIVKYLFYQELIREFKTARDEHPFKDEMNTELEARAGYIERYFDIEVRNLMEESPTEKWDAVVRDVYELKLDQKQDELEDSNFWEISKKKRIKEKIDELETRQGKLNSQFETYEGYEDGLAEARRRRDDVEVMLQSSRNNIEGEFRTEKSERLDDLNNRINEIESTKQTKETQLEESVTEKDGRFVDLPFTKFEDVTDEKVEEAEGIPDFVDAHVVKKEEVTRGVSNLLEILDEPLEDETRVDVSADEILTVLTNDANSEIPGGQYDADVEGADAGSKFQQFSETISCEYGYPFSIRFIALYVGVRLENSSEFGTIHETYVSEDPVTKYFPIRRSDETFVTAKFAYPELFPDDEQIQKHFMKRLS